MSGEQIKPGYKRTEVGVIPEDWEVRRLSEHFQIYAGGDVPKNSLSQIRSDTHPHPIFANALQNNGLYGFTAERRAKADSVTVTARGYLGHAEYRTEEFFPIVRLLVLEPMGSLDARFTTFAINERVDFAFESTGVPQLTAPQIGKYSVAAPPVPEQHSIATTLSDMDTLLAKLDQLIAKKRDLKQATMQQLLTGQTRLPGFAPVQPKFTKTALGIFPEDWLIHELSKLIEMSRGIRYGIVQPGKFDPAGRYMIRGQDYSEVNGWAASSEIFRVSPETEARYQNARVKAKDLIMTIVGYCGHVEKIPDWLDGANLTQTTARIAIDSGKASSDFCKYMLSGPVGRNQVASSMKGAAQPGLNCGDLARFLLPLPSIPEQSAIASVFSDMDAELAGLEAQSTELKPPACMTEKDGAWYVRSFCAWIGRGCAESSNARV